MTRWARTGIGIAQTTRKGFLCCLPQKKQGTTFVVVLPRYDVDD
jgi:hypothetical protein